MTTENPPSGSTIILGAGVAGLATAWKLPQLDQRNVLLLEREAHAGGLAATVAFGDARLDVGSHRIHPAYYPEALALLQQLLGDDLLRVPRRGRLRLNGRFVDYPPSLADLVAALGPLEIARCALALLAQRVSRKQPAGDNFENFLVGTVGRRLYELFYAPYARKVFGIHPTQVSATAAKMRITTGSPWAIAREVVLKWLGGAPARVAYFYYPARGFGSIAAALQRAAVTHGVRVQTGVAVRAIRLAHGRVREVEYACDGVVTTVPAAAVVSTIPLNQLLRLLDPAPPDDVCAAAKRLRWRGIRLLQIRLARARCLDGETYYFPEERYLFGRISEPRQYSPRLVADPGETALNIEVICTPGDALWEADESAFCERVFADIDAIGLFRRHEVRAYRSLRVPAVYPVYDLDFQRHLDTALGWVESHGNLYSIGRGGMLLHGNTDHSIYLGLRLAEHLAEPGAHARGWRADLPAEDFRVRD
jgi:protoporphyrinogen oxidase